MKDTLFAVDLSMIETSEEWGYDQKLQSWSKSQTIRSI